MPANPTPAAASDDPKKRLPHPRGSKEWIEQEIAYHDRLLRKTNGDIVKLQESIAKSQINRDKQLKQLEKIKDRIAVLEQKKADISSRIHDPAPGIITVAPLADIIKMGPDPQTSSPLQPGIHDSSLKFEQLQESKDFLMPDSAVPTKLPSAVVETKTSEAAAVEAPSNEVRIKAEPHDE